LFIMPALFPNTSAIIAAALAGALIAYAAYRGSAKRKAQKWTALDLRAELRAEQESLRTAIEALPAQIDLARQSRAATAQGTANTGPVEQWLHELDLDLAEAELLRSQLSEAESDHQALSDMDAEIKLVEVLALSLRASTLADKYRSSSGAVADNADSLLQEVRVRA
jgi:hypothetical protein